MPDTLEVNITHSSVEDETSAAKALGQSTEAPFYIYKEFVKLRTKVQIFRGVTSFLLESVSEEEPLAMRVEAKVHHYNEVFDQLEDDMNELLWNICQGKKQLLPGSPSRWKARLDYTRQGGHFPPVNTSTPKLNVNQCKSL